METIFTGLFQFLYTNAFVCGLFGMGFSILLLVGLIYLYLNRNEVMTLTYGVTLLSMFVFVVVCISAMLLTSIYGITR